MLTGILLIYVGTKIAAPALYFWGCGIMIGVSFIRLCVTIYNAGRDA